ncbi:DUF4240 domain-containing protein [Nonomuraea sp. NPDC001684]
MDIDGFWDLVERSAQETATRQERVSWLEEHLSRLSAEEIVDYEAWFTLCANRACTWDMYAACWTITGSGSSDGFEYFVDWLISLGRGPFGKGHRVSRPSCRTSQGAEALRPVAELLPPADLGVQGRRRPARTADTGPASALAG